MNPQTEDALSAGFGMGRSMTGCSPQASIETPPPGKQPPVEPPGPKPPPVQPPKPQDPPVQPPGPKQPPVEPPDAEEPPVKPPQQPPPMRVTALAALLHCPRNAAPWERL